MIDDRHIKLMNKEIDGVNSERESAELREYLSENADARLYHDQLLEVARIFKEAGDIEPPAGLKESILSKIAAQEAGLEKRAIFSNVFDFFRPAPIRRCAYVFAAGVAVGVSLLFLFGRIAPHGPSSNLKNFYGTLSKGESKERLPGEPLSSRPVQFSAPGVSCSVRAEYTPEKTRLFIDLDTQRQVRLIFQHDSRVNFAGVKVPDECSHNLKVTGDKIEITHSGICSYVIELKNVQGAYSPLNLKLWSDSGLLLEKEILPERR